MFYFFKKLSLKKTSSKKNFSSFILFLQAKSINKVIWFSLKHCRTFDKLVCVFK